MAFEAIPNFTELRADKPGYDTRFQIDTNHPLHNDPLVDMREFEGFEDANSYYAKPNAMTGEPLPGVPNAPLIRHDIAQRLVRANTFLATNPDVREALGAPARIRVDDALRPQAVQRYAYEKAWPAIIARMHPELSSEQVLEQVPNYCAKPGSDDKLTPTPHLTGGAVDVALVNLETGKAFDRGHQGGKVKGTAFPDFHEGYHLTEGASDIANSPEQTEAAAPGSEIVLGRRVLYHAMTNIGELTVNPNEIWHYGAGDPLSAYVNGGQPYYGVAELPEWYQQQMEQ